MASCPSCGKANREGALFCQECGTRFADAAPSPTRPCPSCGTSNAISMCFCKSCGAPQSTMPGPSVARPLPSAAPAQAGRQSCGSCGGQTPAGFAFCQHCGKRLGGAPALAPSPAPALAPPPVSSLRPVAAMAAPALPSPLPPLPPLKDGLAPTISPRGEAVAVGGVEHAAFGATMIGDSQSLGIVFPTSADLAPGGQQVPREDGHQSTLAGGEGPRLVSVRRDGTDGETYLLLEDLTEIGRSARDLRFADDPFLAPQHARIEQRDGRFSLLPLDETNGLYLRLREGVPLEDGAQFLVGQQLFRFEVPIAEEQLARLAQHGVRLFGTPLRPAWGRIRQLSSVGTTRDIYHLDRPQMVLGRTEGDLLFGEDEFMSRRHAVLMSDGGTCQLDDLGSSNGTYIRLRQPYALVPGDQVRLGDQLLRFETI